MLFWWTLPLFPPRHSSIFSVLARTARQGPDGSKEKRSRPHQNTKTAWDKREKRSTKGVPLCFDTRCCSCFCENTSHHHGWPLSRHRTCGRGRLCACVHPKLTTRIRAACLPTVVSTMASIASCVKNACAERKTSVGFELGRRYSRLHTYLRALSLRQGWHKVRPRARRCKLENIKKAAPGERQLWCGNPQNHADVAGIQEAPQENWACSICKRKK